MSMRDHLGILGGAIVVGAVVGGATGAVVASDSPGLGSLAEWVSGVGTAGALLLTAWTLSEQRRSARAAIIRGQAEYVSAWCVRTNPEAAQNRLQTRVAFRNASHLPIYDVAVTVYPTAKWEASSSWVTRDDIGAVGPGEYAERDVFVEPLQENLGTHTPVAVTFTDAAGRRWRRQPNGTLEQQR